VKSSELLSFKDENQPPGDQERNLHSIKGVDTRIAFLALQI